MKRREFVKLTAMAGAAAMWPWRTAHAAFAQSPALQKFLSPLRGLGDMAAATKVAAGTYAAGAGHPGVDYYEIAVRQFTDWLHPNLPPTALWGYGNKADDVSTFRHLGGAIVATKGTATRIRVFNELPGTHILPVDDTVPGVDPATMAMQNRVAVHLHGGHVPWTSDGGPHHWFTGNTGPAGTVRNGLSYTAWLPDPNGGAMTGDYWYPNDQSARLMWYHDHAVGITRLNAYAGIATAYLLTDAAEGVLVGSGMVPALQIPIVVQDKVFNPNGSLWYPSMYDVQFFFLQPGGAALPPVSLVPEFWGDTMLVNGTIFPFTQVEPRRYRLRLLNACNTRFLSLRVVPALGKRFPDSAEPDANAAGPMMQLIGTEGGFLDNTAAPQGVLLGDPKNPLLLAPAERADVIIDFSKVKPGQFLILHNDAPVPFPGGTPLADFHPGNNKLAIPPLPGFGPNTRTLLQFQVVGLGTLTGDPLPDPAPTPLVLPPNDPPPIVPFGTMGPLPYPVRNLTLNEAFDAHGRLAQLIGGVTPTVDALGFPGFGLEYGNLEPGLLENPTAGSTEVWNVFNLTADAHPIHIHLANCQIISRQPFNVKQFNGVPSFTAAPRPPDPSELGWKETVKMYPGECTTLLMKFDLPVDPVIPVTTLDAAGLPVTTPTVADPGNSPRTGGKEYVYHCHILEHEEHDMMRPLIIT